MKPIAFNWQAGGADDPALQNDVSTPLRRKQTVAMAFTCKDSGADATNDIAPTLRAMPRDANHANGAGQVAVAFAIQGAAGRENPSSGPDGIGVREDVSYTLEARSEVQAVAFAQNQRDEVRTMDVAGALASEPRMKQQTYVQTHAMVVRKLTVVECARLQGFPDTYLDIMFRGRPAADGNKYKALGNSFAVPVVHWIGKRIQQVIGESGCAQKRLTAGSAK